MSDAGPLLDPLGGPDEPDPDVEFDREQYESDLADAELTPEELVAKWTPKKVEKGDRPGHDFHGNQYVAYRGLHLGQGQAPTDDAEILARLRQHGRGDDPTEAAARDWPVYGHHWTTDQSIAKQFATRTANNVPQWRGLSRKDGSWGVVLEAKMAEPPRESESQRGYGESESWAPRMSQIKSLTAHVHQYPALSEDTPGARHRRSRAETYVRSFEVPVPRG